MWDVIIIGSGAGGGPLALRLSQAGAKVLVLERGSRHTRVDYEQDPIVMGMSRGLFVPPVQSDPHIVIDHRAADPAPVATQLGWTACCVGGGTAHMGGALYRFHPDDFRLRSRFGSYELIEDWPYSYESLEPYYAQAEWEIGVSGSASANPSEGSRSRPYPMEPLHAHPLATKLDEACRRLGMQGFATPRAINSQPYGGRPACSYCSFCAGYGCPTGARGGTHEALLPRAEATGQCEIRANSMVREITIGRDGRATGCIYIDGIGAEHVARSNTVCVCCSAVETARLLLLSKSSLFPQGLLNDAGLVGRGLQFHVGSFVRARFRYDRHGRQLLDALDCVLGRSVADHYFLDASPSGFPKGGIHGFELLSIHPIAAAQACARDPRTNRLSWGASLQQRLHERFRSYREIACETFQDFIPNVGTYVELDPDVTDPWGLPVARIHLTESDHHRLAGEILVGHARKIFDEMGADDIAVGSVGYTNKVMAHGTCRAGANPAQSVLDEFCRAHAVKNLYVVDGSFMPTSGGAPSTLTIIANSFRTADDIIGRARSFGR